MLYNLPLGHAFFVIWSVKHNFVVITFKGTSPYNLTEWLENCTLRKKASKNGVLPGLIHTVSTINLFLHPSLEPAFIFSHIFNRASTMPSDSPRSILSNLPKDTR